MSSQDAKDVLVAADVNESQASCRVLDGCAIDHLVHGVFGDQQITLPWIQPTTRMILLICSWRIDDLFQIIFQFIVILLGLFLNRYCGLHLVDPLIEAPAELLNGTLKNGKVKLLSHDCVVFVPEQLLGLIEFVEEARHVDASRQQNVEGLLSLGLS